MVPTENLRIENNVVHILILNFLILRLSSQEKTMPIEASFSDSMIVLAISGDEHTRQKENTKSNESCKKGTLLINYFLNIPVHIPKVCITSRIFKICHGTQNKGFE